MATGPITFAELAKINDVSIANYGLYNWDASTPLVDILPAIESSNGNIHKWNVGTEAVTAGERDAYEGLALSHGVNTTKTENLSYFASPVSADVQVVESYSKGIEAYLQNVAFQHIVEVKKAVELAVIAKLRSVVDASMIVDGLGGGSDANVSDLFMIRYNPAEVSIVLGNAGNISLGDFVKQLILQTGSTTEWYRAYTSEMAMQFAVQYGGKYSIGRINNIEVGSSFGDDQMFDLLARFVGGEPNLIVTNRVAVNELRKSRVATSESGSPVGWLNEWNGIKIVTTQAISSTQDVE